MNNTHVRLALFLGALGALGASGAFLGSVSGQASRYAWSLSDTRDGITLYTSDAPAHSYDAVKAVVTLAVAPDALVAVLREISAFPGWYAGCKQTRVLEAPRVTLPIQLAADGRFLPVAGQESFVLYFLQDLPVVNDRWAILRNTLRFGRDGSLTVEFHSLDRYPYKGPADTARMRVSGAWTLARNDPGVVNESSADPNARQLHARHRPCAVDAGVLGRSRAARHCRQHGGRAARGCPQA